jgi:hexosaminidase
MGGTDHADGLWQGWIGADFEATVDLATSQPLDTIAMTFLQNVRSWILFPARVAFAVSDDGTTWNAVGTIANRIPPESEGALLQRLAVPAPRGTRARYVRITVQNGGRLPGWHPGAGRPSWVFADEIIVR